MIEINDEQTPHCHFKLINRAPECGLVLGVTLAHKDVRKRASREGFTAFQTRTKPQSGAEAPHFRAHRKH